MGRRESVSSVNFVKTFAPMAQAGKSALEIGRALGLEGDANKVKQYVSVKASQLRKQLQEMGYQEAKKQGLDQDATQQLVESLVAKLPRLRGAGRPAGSATVMQDVLAQLNAITEAPAAEAPAAEAPAAEAPAAEAPAAEVKPNKQRRGKST